MTGLGDKYQARLPIMMQSGVTPRSMTCSLPASPPAIAWLLRCQVHRQALCSRRDPCEAAIGRNCLAVDGKAHLVTLYRLRSDVLLASACMALPKVLAHWLLGLRQAATSLILTTSIGLFLGQYFIHILVCMHCDVVWIITGFPNSPVNRNIN